MLEHQNILWGTRCDCGEICYILQNKFHPWVETDFNVVIKCPKCDTNININREKASKFYNERIYHYFEGISGKVLDLGCGGGFITSFLTKNNEVTKIIAIDIDESSKIVETMSDHITFIHCDLKDMNRHLKEKVDYMVQRDVFMFIEDTSQYFDDLTHWVTKGLYHMGWYMSGNDRMKNQLLPEDIKKELEERGWMVTIEYLDWYKCGYFIKALK